MPLLVVLASLGEVIGLAEAARTPLYKVNDLCDSKISRNRQRRNISSASVCLGLQVRVQI